MTEEHIMESLSRAYTIAVSAFAGVKCDLCQSFDYGIDGSFKGIEKDGNRIRENGFSIDFQLKSTTNIKLRDDKVVYDLRAKNYNDLINTNVGTERILILFVLPKDNTEWLKLSESELILKKCAWWHSLKGLPKSNNTSTKTIEIPQKQLLTVHEIIKLINTVQEGGELRELCVK